MATSTGPPARTPISLTLYGGVVPTIRTPGIGECTDATASSVAIITCAPTGIESVPFSPYPDCPRLALSTATSALSTTPSPFRSALATYSGDPADVPSALFKTAASDALTTLSPLTSPLATLNDTTGFAPMLTPGNCCRKKCDPFAATVKT